MKKLLRMMSWMLWIGMVAACHPFSPNETENPGTSADSGSQPPTDARPVEEENLLEQQRVISPELAQAIRESGITIHAGVLPLHLVGTYKANGSVTVSQRNDSVGTTMTMHPIVSTQTMYRSIMYQDSRFQGGGWITGEHNKFTMYLSTIYDNSCHHHVVISGEQQQDKVFQIKRLLFFSKTCPHSYWELYTMEWTYIGPPPVPKREYPDADDSDDGSGWGDGPDPFPSFP